MTLQTWTPQEHPRLFFRQDELEELRAKRNADSVAAAAWKRLEEDIEKGMALEWPRESERWKWDTGSDGQKNLGSVALLVSAEKETTLSVEVEG